MASIGHVAVGMSAARLYRAGQKPRTSLIASMLGWSAVSMLPDLDVLGFRYGIRYAAAWGHRGASHSLCFALALGLLCGVLAGAFDLPRARTAVAATLVIASHGLLDTLTNGGLGCALLWPFELTRYFAPWTPIPVAPIGRRLFSERGLWLMASEAVMFLPLFAFALWPRRRASAGGPTR